MPLDTTPAPSLKDWFDEARYRTLASQLGGLHPRFDRKRFLKLTLEGHEDRSLMQRLRRTSEATREALPLDYRESLDVLRQLAPRIDHGFVTLFLPDFVSLYGHEDFDASMDALKFFTPFGSSEFAIREFLKRDLDRTLGVMRGWSLDENEHVRRLASEGCRPRLPWSFRLTGLVADPTPALPILENLKADPSLYVRKSVANHLNDIAKDHPALVAQWLQAHLPDAPEPRRVLLRHASRTLIKQGDAAVLRAWGLGGALRGRAVLQITPGALAVGETLNLQLTLQSTATRPQALALDYVVHHVKANGSTSAKVFKGWQIVLPARGEVVLSKRHSMRAVTTRRYHAGHHAVQVQANGKMVAEAGFDLRL